jgi:hypothetical protein
VAQRALLRAVAGDAAEHELDRHRRVGELGRERPFRQRDVVTADHEHEPAEPGRVAMARNEVVTTVCPPTGR